MKNKRLSLGFWVLIALILGVGVGILLQNHGDITTAYFKPIGDIYVNLLKFLVVPVVLFSIIDGVVSLGGVKKVGSIGWKTVVFFLSTTVLASAIGILAAQLFAAATNRKFGFASILPVGRKRQTRRG